MARSSAATVAPPPAKRRAKPAAKRSAHTSSQTHRPQRRSSGPASGRPPARRRSAAAGARPARAAPPPRRTGTTASKARPAPLVQRLIHGRAGALLDQVLRGRACVAIVFALLVGIVFFNVALLQLNEGIAQTNAKATALEQENAKLRHSLAPLASSERIQREAVKRGYSLPAAGDVGYIRGKTDSNAKKAVERMTAPGMGDGTASRPAAQVEQETSQSATAPPATQPVAPTEPVAAPVATPPPADPTTAPVAATTP